MVKAVVNEQKPRFYRLYVDKPEAKDNPEFYSHTIKNGHLAYDETGKVIPVDDGDFDLWQLIQSDKDSATLQAQIKQMALNGQTMALGVNYADVSDIPDNINDMYSSNLAKKEAAQAAADKVGIDLDGAVRMKQEDLEKLINEKVAAMMAEKTVVKSEVKDNE